jgi:iron complex transport system substrate-binding protein
MNPTNLIKTIRYGAWFSTSVVTFTTALVPMLSYAEPKTAIAPPAAPRVIALAPHLAQLAYAAGAGGSLVAVSEYTPPAYAKQLPLVGNAFAVNWELLAQLKPSLVLVWGSGTSLAVKARLKALGIATFESEPSSLLGIVQEAQALAQRIGTPKDNPDLLALQAKLKAVQDYRDKTNTPNNASNASNTHNTKNTKAFIPTFHPIWPKPLMTLNGQHVVSDALAHCGARNIFAKAKGLSPTVSLAQVLREQPKVIVLAVSPTSATPITTPYNVYDKDSQWYGLLNAFPKQASVQPVVITVNGEKFHQPGPSLIEETLVLCKALNALK